MADKSLNECNDKPFDSPPIQDQPSPFCCPDDVLGQPYGSLKDVPFDGSEQSPPRKLKLGNEANCDPMQQSGWASERTNHSRETINRYSQAIRGADQAMKALFDDISVTDDNGAEHKVPIEICGPEEAVAFILQENVRKDPSFVIDRLKLPILSIYNNDMNPDPTRFFYHKAVNYYRGRRADQKPGWTISENGVERGTVFGKAWGLPINLGYQLNAWTTYKEDMLQIIEQVWLKFSPVAYIRIQGVDYETIVKLDSVLNNQDIEPGDKNKRVIKYQFNMTVETYIPQPIVRKKAVTDIKIDVLETNQDEIIDVLKKIEISANEE